MNILQSKADEYTFSGQSWNIFNEQLSENSVFEICLVCDFSLWNKPILVSYMLSWNLDFPCVPEFRTYSLQVFS